MDLKNGANTSEASERATTVQDSPMQSEGPTREEESEAKDEVQSETPVSPTGRRRSLMTHINELGEALAHVGREAGELGASAAQKAVNVGREAGELGGALATSAAQTAVNVGRVGGELGGALASSAVTLASGVSEYTEDMLFSPTASKGLSKNVHTDEASFEQFLGQVIKAHLDHDDSQEFPTRRSNVRRNLTGILEGGQRGGFFQRCPQTQACCYKVCARLENSVFFGIFCWAFLLLHCIALVRVANNDGSPEFWYTVSESYMVFFVLELLVRIGAAPNRYFWQSGYVVLDILLLLASIAEALLPSISDQFGQGQFTLLTLHLLRFLRGLQSLNMPESASAVTACFGGLLPFFLFFLLCCVWCLFAAVWYLVFSSTTFPVVQFNHFGSAVLTQFYLACHAMDWDRITEPLEQAGTQTATLLAALFVVTLLGVLFLTANGAIIIFHELAGRGIADYQQTQGNKDMRRRLLGLSRLEESLERAACGLGASREAWGEWLMQSRARLADALGELKPSLKVLKITAEEILQLYDHLYEVSHGALTVSELLFGILRMISPAEVAELLQVDHMQKQCIQVAESSMGSMERQIEKGRQQLDRMESSVSQLQLHLRKMRSQARRARQELSDLVVEVEQQYQGCMASVHEAASMRQLHLRLTHENSRQEVFNRLHVAQRSLSNLRHFSTRVNAFGFPQVADGEAWDQAEQDSQSAFGDPGQFDKVANMLQAEVKKRIGTRLRQYLELQTLNAPDAPAAGT